MTKFTKNRDFRIGKIQEAALAIQFTAEQCKWTSVGNIQDSLNRLTNDALLMKPNNKMTLEERQACNAHNVAVTTAYCLSVFLENPNPSENEIALNDADLKAKLIDLANLIN